jgi:type I restriction enzyme, S subunit
LKRVARLAYGDALPGERYEDGAVDVLGSNGTVGAHATANTSGPTIVIGRKGSFGKVTYSPNSVFAIDTTFFVDRQTTSENIRWLFHVLSWLRLDQVSKDSAVPGLDRNDAYARYVPVPPQVVQSAIARLLDYVDSCIFQLISAKERLIELAKEEKQRIIYGALTRGFDSNAALVASGIDWLGDVPAHWNMRRLKWAIRLQRGYDLPADQRLTGDVPVVSSGGIVGTHVEARAKGPGVVMGRYGSTGSVYFVDQDFWPHNTSLYVTHFNGNVPEWAYYLLQVIPKAELSAKSAVPGVDRRDLHDIFVVVPPVDEQRVLIDVLTRKIKKVDGAIQIARRQVDLLREYRTRLISDVVTGKLDVREAAMDLPDDPEVDDPGLEERLEEVAAA